MKSGRQAGEEVDSTVAALECRNVSYSYDSVAALDNVDFVVQQGEFAAILGPNGSGKTTLLKLVLGLLNPSQGEIRLFGKSPKKTRSADQIGYVPQKLESITQLFPATVEEIVAQGTYRGLDPFAMWRKSASAPVMEAMESVDISEVRGRRVASLSIGQQQRVLVARALVREAKMLVLDEPIAGVDVAGQEKLYAMLRRLNQDRGITVILVSHDIGAVMRKATTVACINRTMVFHGPPRRLTQAELSTLYGMEMDILMHDALHEHR